MLRQQALCVVFAQDSPTFPESLRFIPRGIMVGNGDGIPQGWLQVPPGRLGLAHGYLFQEEIERDCAVPGGVIYLPPPLSGISPALVQADFITLVSRGDRHFLVGRKSGLYFKLEARDLNPFRQNSLQRHISTPPPLPGNRGVAVFFCHWQGGYWDEKTFSGIEWIGWEELKANRQSADILEEVLPTLQLSQKKESVELGYRRCQPQAAQDLLKSPPVTTSHSHCFEDAYISSIKGVAKRNLAASMQGEAQLAVKDLVYRFQQGRLAEFSWGPAKNQKTGRVQSWIEIEGRKIFFVGVSSVAIEGDHEWGLRESLVAESPLFLQPGRLVVDYLLTDRTDELSVSLSIRWPVFRRAVRITGWAPWELPLGRFGLFEKYEIRALNEDGWQNITEMPAVARCLALRLSQQGSGVGFRFYQGQSHRPHFLPIRKQGGAIWINPEGSYDPLDSQELEGYTEHHNWALFRSNQESTTWSAEPADLFISPLVQK